MIIEIIWISFLQIYKSKALTVNKRPSTRSNGSTIQKAIKGPKITSVKPFKRENQQSNLYKKRETRNTYKLHKQTTTTVHQIPD